MRGRPTVTSTTRLPDLACLAIKFLTLAMSSSSAGGGGCVAKYVPAEKGVDMERKEELFYGTELIDVDTVPPLPTAMRTRVTILSV